MGMKEWRASDEALTYMASLSAESKLSSANLTTSVTLRVIHSSLPKIASQKNLKNVWYPIFYGYNSGRNYIFKDISAIAILRGLNECREVVLNGLELADGSLLTAERYKTESKGAIRRLHSIHFIFHLIIYNYGEKELCGEDVWWHRSYLW